MINIFQDQTPESVARLRAEWRREAVRSSTLTRFDFKSGPVHYCDRVVGFTDGAGQYWEGGGDVISISQITGGTDNLATFMTYTIAFPVEGLQVGALSRVPDIIGNEEEYLKREASLLIQYFDDDGPIGVPIVFDTGLMYSPKVSARREVLALSINAENPLLNKRRPRHGDLTSKAQRARYPTDAGLDYVPNSATEPKDWLNS